MGAAVAHYIVTPMAMRFFIGYSDAIPRLANLVAGSGTFETPATADSQHARPTNQCVRQRDIVYCAAGAGLPKSTLGALEMAFSFSTAKLGLV